MVAPSIFDIGLVTAPLGYSKGKCITTSKLSLDTELLKKS